MITDIPPVVCPSVLPLSSPSSSDEDSCVVKVGRREQLLLAGDWFVQSVSCFQYVNRSDAELQFDYLRTSTPTYESGERQEQLGHRPRKQEEVCTSFSPPTVPQVFLWS